MSAFHESRGEPVICVRQLGKAYNLYKDPKDRLWSLLAGRSRAHQHWALQGVAFALHRGQCLGLVGSNGAGKSTLLKLLAGTLLPSTGSVKVDGRLTAILELGAGFHPEFTGRENLFFGGSLIGLDADRVGELLPGIAEFSELGAALDRPVKTYSSGMVVRLAFALVTAVEPAVLIIDEALAVGDQHFQKKCIDRINRFRENGCTILFCSHSMYHVRHLCDRALWLDQGQMRAVGPVEEVLSLYEAHVKLQDAQGSGSVAQPISLRMARQATGNGELSPNHRAELVNFWAEGLPDEEMPLLARKDLIVHVTARVAGDECPHFGVMLEQAQGTGITAVTTHTDGVVPRRNAEGLWETTLTFPDLPLFSGEYVLSAYLFDETGLVVYEEWLKCLHFRVLHPSTVPGLVRLPHHWS